MISRRLGAAEGPGQRPAHRHGAQRVVAGDVEPLGVGEVVDRDPLDVGCDAELHPGPPVAVAVGKRHHARHHLVCRSDLDLHLADPRRHRDGRSVRQTARVQVVGVHQQVVAGTSLREPLGVVHPRVAVALVAPADQHQLLHDDQERRVEEDREHQHHDHRAAIAQRRRAVGGVPDPRREPGGADAG